jgi:hypothetical protein
MYPAWEVDRGLVASGDSEVSLLSLLVGGSGCGNITGNGNTSSPEIICDAANVKFDIVHLTKLLCRLLVIAPRLGIELHPVVAVLTLTAISGMLEQWG